MTETGQVPGEGVPENAGGQQETPQFAVPSAPAGPGLPGEPGEMSSPGAYAYHEPAESGAEDDDLLLMPGAQGAWSEHSQLPYQMYAQGQPTAVPPQSSSHSQEHTPARGHVFAQGQHPSQVPVQHTAEADAHWVGTHETGGRDTGSVDYSAVRTPAPADPQPSAAHASTPASPAPARRPLHLGPPVPDSSGGVVRSLADRGPAPVASTPVVSAAQQPGLYIAGPGYPHMQPHEEAVHEEAVGVPGLAEQTTVPGEGTPARGISWETQAPAPATTPVPADNSAGTPTGMPAGAGDDGTTGTGEQPVAPIPAPVGETGHSSGYLSGFGNESPEQPQPGAEPAQAPGEAAAETESHRLPGQSHPHPEPAATEQSHRSSESGSWTVTQEIPHPNAAVSTGGGAEHGEAAQAAVFSVAAPFPPEDRGWQSADTGSLPGIRQEAPGAGPAAQAGAVTAAQESAHTPDEPRIQPEPEQASGIAETAAVVPQAGEPAGPHRSEPATGSHAVPADAVPADVVPVQQPTAAAGPSGQVTEQAPSEDPDRGQAPAPGETGADAATDAAAGAPEDGAARPAAPAFSDAEREAVLRVMRERRDIRNGFRSDPIPNDVLRRVLEAAHTAPSVGHSQPWDFVVIRSAETRRMMHELAMRQREAYAKSLPKGRAKQFRQLKIEAILDTPVNIVITADPTRGGRHTLGRHTQPQMAPYSSALAVENLWLAARAEGLGVGWVSFFDEREMVRALGLPEHLEVVAYLCVGYVDEFPAEPELVQAGWSKRRPLSWVVHEEAYGRRALPGEEPHDLLAETLQGIRPLDAKALGEAWERQKRMTKPAGALGMLEIISAQLCGLSRKCPPPIPEPAAVAIFAGDHGVHAQGVTPWPQEVTAQMVANFLAGGAVCNAFAGQVGAEVCVVDVGVVGELPGTPGLLPRKVRPGTDDFTTGPALSREDVLRAIEVGIETARDLVAAGNKALLTGEMGIANTTVSATLISVYTGADPSEVTGRGTGINDETHARKVEVVRRALELHQPDPADPIGVLAAVGGLEHAAIVGLVLGGASLRTPVILDGVSAGAAALVARAIAPEALAACIAGHRSAEPGHVAALTKLGLRPLVDLDLRLGEGTGALLALPLVQSAARAMHEVATFDSAGVTEKSQ